MLPPPGFRDVVLCGSGATSRVFRATSAATGRTVALKRLHPQLARDAEALSRLRRELVALGRLQHPAIVPVFDVIRWQGDPTIVMDYVPGRDLKEWIALKGPLPFAEAERILRALLDVVHVAHGAGIVHRDVKPQNVRLGEDGRLFLLDFGSARLEASSQLTATGTSVGTPDYMAPELFAGPVYDPRVDLYGVGATLFEALTGRAPQLADNLTALAWQRTHEDAPPVRSLREGTPEHVAQVVDRLLSRAPDDRYSAAAQAIWALDHPEAERRFAARRSKNPPCLHCGAAIPPESNLCAACGSDHPFCFRPGHASVDLVAIREPAGLARELVETFPELGEELDHLTQRFAAVGTGPQRVASMIDRDEAIALAERLREAGADCQVEEDPGMSRSNTRGPAWAAFVFVLGTIAAFACGLPFELAVMVALSALLPALGALVAERLFALERASNGIVARAPSSPAPAARFALAAAAPALFAAGVALPPLARLLGMLSLADLQLPLFLGSSATALAALAARRIRITRKRKLACGSPEPNALEKIRSAFTAPTRSIAPLKQQVATALTIAVLALVPAELALAAAMRDVVPTFWSIWSGAATELPAYAPASWDPPLEAPPEAPLEQAAPDELPPPPDLPYEPAPSAPPRASSAPLLPSWLDGRAMALLGSVLALDLALLAFLLWRRRRFAREGRRLLSELAVELPQPKSAPISRAPARTLTLADRIAERRSDDAFLEAAKRRATELAHHLDPSELARVTQMLDRAEARSEKSFLARCILETDADLALRFELLRIAGKLEASAAERWAESRPEDR
jgi:tRNA A-37 threonylcarbamoyl transferase component Bud32